MPGKSSLSDILATLESVTPKAATALPTTPTKETLKVSRYPSRPARVSTPDITRDTGKGRSRFHNECPFHGASDDGAPCARFSHLPGNGRGPVKMNRKTSNKAALLQLLPIAGLLTILLLIGVGLVLVVPRALSFDNYVGNMTPAPIATITPTPSVTP